MFTSKNQTSLPENSDPLGRSLDLLEFPAVKQKLAALTSLTLAYKEALSLRPSSDPAVIAYRQKETQEGRSFLESKGVLELSAIGDTQSLVERAALDGVLKGAELREVHDTLRASRKVKTTLGGRKNLPILSALSTSLPDLTLLESDLASAVDPTGAVLDNASPALAGLRAQAQEAYTKLVEALERTIRLMRRSNSLQEHVITERNGRLVLLVKIEMRNRVPGIVHDISDSGSTAFIEPIKTVSLGNQWREASLAVKREEETVLRTLSSKVGDQDKDIFTSLRILASLDLAIAKGHYSLEVEGIPPVFIEAGKSSIRLSQGRHPLLQGAVVPVDMSISDEQGILLITGPNAGGKTVALKALGLLTVMAHAGLHVPASHLILTTFDGVYADIGDRQSIELSLSSFSSHLQNLKSITDTATSGSLVLLDELGTSTDPEEGAALAKALLSYFSVHGILCVATTHHRDVAAYTQECPGMKNASVELDPKTLDPTYKLTTGMPGRSYALTIAARMGIAPQTIEKARSLLSPEHRQAEELLHQLEEARYLAEQQRKAAGEELVRAQRARQELEEKLENLEKGSAALLEEARRKLQSQADSLWKRLQRAERALSAPLAKPQLSKQTSEANKIREELKSARWRPAEGVESDWIKELKPGDHVYIQGIPQPVEVLSQLNQNHSVEVLLGSLKAWLPSYQLVGKARAPSFSATDRISIFRTPTPSLSSELDLRGLRLDEAEIRLEDFLDKAVLHGLTVVNVIHGGGTGALRNMVRERLRIHPLAKSSHPLDDRANDGVTVVKLD